MRIRLRIAQVLVLVALLALGAVAIAVVAQYAFDMQPCPWCVLQGTRVDEAHGRKRH